jgi:phosphoribosylaminoimidazole-succinocarboxamide synthase
MSVADTFIRSGKVRDLYAVGADRLLLVASDRISAYDVVLPTSIPDKGKVLTGLSRFWFEQTERIVPNHLLSTDVDDIDPVERPRLDEEHRADADALRGRVMLCRRVDVLPVELIVRGYLAGSGWRDYRATGSIAGIELPHGLRESDRLPELIFTPSTKADIGIHDETITFDRMASMIGAALAERLRDLSLRLYTFAADVCERAGILLADTKFEFGVWPGPADLVLVDEVLTPDSSRFWDAATWSPGGPQASFDKQFVRDWLDASGWDHRPPAPALPLDVVEGTRGRYVEAFERITGASFARYVEEDVIE